MALFILKNVNYQDIVRYPHMEISEGIVTFVCGESGSGKSTLLKLLNGVLSPSEGEILYRNQAPEDYDSIQLRREVLLLGQSAYLFDKSIRDNFDEYYRYRGIEALSDEQMKAYLNICAVDLPLDSMCQVLSGGERQRIFTAINLSYQPKVFMMDEPTSALDEQNARMLVGNIKAYCKEHETSLIIVSHDQAMADTYADDTIRLSRSVNV